MIFVIHLHLLRNHFPVFLRDPRHIQLIAKGSCQCHMSPGLKGRHTAYCMVRAVADMCAHSRQRINQRCSFLDLQTFDRISIIRAPDLRAVIKHTRVKPGSAAGAVLQKQVRKFRYQTLLHLINTQHIPMIKLLLMLLVQIGASKVTKLTVHVPFYISDIGTP